MPIMIVKLFNIMPNLYHRHNVIQNTSSFAPLTIASISSYERISSVFVNVGASRCILINEFTRIFTFKGSIVEMHPQKHSLSLFLYTEQSYYP